MKDLHEMMMMHIKWMIDATHNGVLIFPTMAEVPKMPLFWRAYVFHFTHQMASVKSLEHLRMRLVTMAALTHTRLLNARQKVQLTGTVQLELQRDKQDRIHVKIVSCPKNECV